MTVPMLTYETGKLFPHPIDPPGVESCLLSTNTSFVDMIYWIEDSTPADIDMFTKAPLRHVVSIEEDIPTLYIRLLGAYEWSFDASFNFLNVDPRYQKQWLDSPGNLVTMYLVDAHRGILLGIRAISLQHAEGILWRQACRKQLPRYGSPQAIDQAIIGIQSR